MTNSSNAATITRRTDEIDLDDGIDLDDIQSLDAFVHRYSYIADEPRMRWWIFNRRTNGLEASGAVLKRNGRWFVVVPRMKSWILQAA